MLSHRSEFSSTQVAFGSPLPLSRLYGFFSGREVANHQERRGDPPIVCSLVLPLGLEPRTYGL